MGACPARLFIRITITDMRWRAAFAAMLLAASLGGCDDAPPDGAGPLVGRDLSGLTLETLDGEVEPLSAYRGKTVVLNFWATWCAPCRWEMPALEELSRRVDPAGLAVIGIAVDENPLMVRSYMREKKLTFARHADPGSALTESLGLEGLPATLILDPEGRVRFQISGGREWDDPDVRRRFGLE